MPEKKGRGEGLARGIFVTAAVMLVARSFGFIRELFVSSVFGPGNDTDAIYASITYVTTLMTVSAMATPTVIARAVYSDPLVKDDTEARRKHLWAILTAWSVLLALYGLFGAFATRPLGSVLAASNDPAFTAILDDALRLTGVVFFLQGLVIAMTAIANAERQHSLAAMVGTGFPLGTMLGALLLGRRLGPMSILLGAIVASSIQVAVLLRRLIREGLGPTLRFDAPSRAGIKRAALVAAPLFLSAAVMKLDLPIAVRLVSRLEPGNVFVLSLSVMLVSVPMSIVSSAVSQPALPELARVSDDPSAFRALFASTSELALLLVLPVAALFLVDSEGVVRVLLRHGRFDDHAAMQASELVRIWGGATWFLVQVAYIDDALGAFGKQRIIAIARALFVPFLAGAMWLGGERLGLVGIVIGFVGTSGVRYVIMLEVLARTTGTPRLAMWTPILKAMVAGTAACAVGGALRYGFTSIAFPLFPRVAIEGITIAVVVLVAAQLLAMPSVRVLVARARGYMRRGNA